MRNVLYLLLALSVLADLVLGTWAGAAWGSYARTWRLDELVDSDGGRLLGLVLGLCLFCFAALQILAGWWIRQDKEEGFRLLILFGIYLMVSSVVTFLAFARREFLLVDGLRGAAFTVLSVMLLTRPSTVTELRLPVRAVSSESSRRDERGRGRSAGMRESERGSRGRGRRDTEVSGERRPRDSRPDPGRDSRGGRDDRTSRDAARREEGSRRRERPARKNREEIAPRPESRTRPGTGEPPVGRERTRVVSGENAESRLTVVVKGGSDALQRRPSTDVPPREEAEVRTPPAEEIEGASPVDARRRRRRRRRSRGEAGEAAVENGADTIEEPAELEGLPGLIPSEPDTEESGEFPRDEGISERPDTRRRSRRRSRDRKGDGRASSERTSQRPGGLQEDREGLGHERAGEPEERTGDPMESATIDRSSPAVEALDVLSLLEPPARGGPRKDQPFGRTRRAARGHRPPPGREQPLPGEPEPGAGDT